MSQEREDELIAQAFAKLDAPALGFAVGLLCAVILFASTLYLTARGGEHIGLHLRLLGQFFPGYAVTAQGSLMGMVYGFGCGFVVGWLIATLRNSFMYTYLFIVRLKANLSSMRDYLDRL